MGSGIGYQSPYKRYDRPEIACWGFGCSNSEERMCKYECWQETSGTAWEQNPRRNLQGTWDHQTSYAMYERDERVPRDEVKVRISNFFGVSVQELFFN